jgi:UDP-arabinose 4-epimerase
MPISCAGVRSLTPIFYAAFERHRPGAVIHFAAYVGESMLRPLAYYRINVAGLVSILEAMLRYHTQTIVFSSSCATYGIPDGLPIAENAPQRPINPYGRSKLVGEQFLVDAHTADGLRIAILRYFNAAGADPEGQLVERHNPETLQSRWPPSSYRVVFGRLPAAPS